MKNFVGARKCFAGVPFQATARVFPALSDPAPDNEPHAGAGDHGAEDGERRGGEAEYKELGHDGDDGGEVNEAGDARGLAAAHQGVKGVDGKNGGEDQGS